MAITMYTVSAPLFRRSLAALSVLLGKGAAFAHAKKIDPAVLLQSRLAPDMFPLLRQVQIASDMAKGCVARLAGTESPNYADTETSIPELQDRLARTIEYIGTFTPAQIDGTEGKEIVLKLRNGEQRFSGEEYLTYFVLPNVFFHCTTAYDILRHNGVELGKRDYLGAR